MKQIFSTRMRVIPSQLSIKTQQHKGDFAPTIEKKGIGFALAYITKQLGYEVFEIADTNSMLPAFDYDHLLYAKPLNPLEQIKLNNIYIYKDLSGALIVHRVIAENDPSLAPRDLRYKFKGDNNLFADGWIPRERILYRVAVISYDR